MSCFLNIKLFKFNPEEKNLNFSRKLEPIRKKDLRKILRYHCKSAVNNFKLFT